MKTDVSRFELKGDKKQIEIYLAKLTQSNRKGNKKAKINANNVEQHINKIQQH